MTKEKLPWIILSFGKNNDLFKPVIKNLFKNGDMSLFDVYWLTTNNNKAKIQTEDYPVNILCVDNADWKREITAQLQELSNVINGNYFILMLDDFIFHKPFNSRQIYQMAKEAEKRQLNYVRLKKEEKSIFNLVLKLYTASFDNFKTINKSHPYYSSLQLSVWDLQYIETIIERSKNIWDFETIKTDYRHYLCDLRLPYSHILERGELFPWAIKYIGSEDFERYLSCKKSDVYRAYFKKSKV